MNKRINEAINNKFDNCILPFLWLHGESKERVKEEIIAIKNSGILAFCVESRVYEDFCKEQWWDDFGFILKTAKELGMKVWLLDDKRFPTGYANGHLESDERADLRMKNIRMEVNDVSGPRKKIKILVDKWLDEKFDEGIIGVYAYKHIDEGEKLDYESVINLTPNLSNGTVYCDIPQGTWRICTYIKTRPYYDFDQIHNYYIDMLNKESCRVMIDAIYQPHYEHFKEYFGTTFMGFFSDEPAFHNDLSTYNYKLGRIYGCYPWRDDLPKLIAQSAGVLESEVWDWLVGVWGDIGDKTALIRMHYMEVISKLYSENFCSALGEWCREHGVMYIGHVIEDSNAHMRTGEGTGHFFRALDGQDMSGMDIVLMQEVPGVINCVHRVPLFDDGYANPTFFHYTLPKMAVSHSHIQPLKKGRTMCEIFGAFGWAEGLPYMKQLADTMLVSGVNYFVPHAFSVKEDDPDCPPHFYNGGKNIQYPLFGKLMDYMNRTSHIMSDGEHIASVAVFYNAEGEWCGGKNETFDNICKTLTQGLIDFDIIPYDYLKNADIKDGMFYVNNESYKALIVSESEIMPYGRLEALGRLADGGVPVIFTNSLPEKSAEGKDISELISKFECIPTKETAELLRSKGIYEIASCNGDSTYLRFYHKKNNNEDIYMFSNDDVCGTLDTWLVLPQTGEYLVYDAWSNKYFKGETKDGKLHLVIEGGNAVIVCFGSKIPNDAHSITYETDRINADLKFDIYLDGNLYEKNCSCTDITSPDRKPDFYGEIVYITEFVPKNGYTVLDLGEVGETAEVWLNDEYIGSRINSPYKFDISKAKCGQNNKLKIRVMANAAHANRDDLSRYIWVPPTGIIGDVCFCRYD